MCSRADNIAKALNELAGANLTRSAPAGTWNQLIEEYFVDNSESNSESSDSDDDYDEILNGVPSAIISENMDVEQLNDDANGKQSDSEEEGLGKLEKENEVEIETMIMKQVDFIDPDSEKEMDKICLFKCECVSRRKENSKKGLMSYSERLSPEFIYRCRQDMVSLTSDEKDLVIIGKISSLGNFSDYTERSKHKTQKKRSHQKTAYLVEGKTICRSTFRFVNMISQSVLDSCFIQYKENGISPRLKKRGGRRTKNRNILSHDDIRRVVSFICNYAEEHAIILPGRHPGQKKLDIKLLPSYVTKSSVHGFYKEEVTKLGHRAAKISSFHSLWKSLTPHITRTKPMSDLCWQCCL
ncbi:uncharacterized protein LOC126811218 [Patella vulgata]|uniref:uncharacterized protein LOC126811218 n=1 Tax=Patella vulgata TaxID=6465 RepID=UPI00218000CB|nr:uncharacterized protein LOC126811218 [Patella vulgata]